MAALGPENIYCNISGAPLPLGWWELGRAKVVAASLVWVLQQELWCSQHPGRQHSDPQSREKPTYELHTLGTSTVDNFISDF